MGSQNPVSPLRQRTYEVRSPAGHPHGYDAQERGNQTMQGLHTVMNRLIAGLACCLLGGCPQPIEQAPITVNPPTTPALPTAPPPPPSNAQQKNDRVQPGTVDLSTPAPTMGDVTYDPGAICPGCDVVLISVCSLRADHLGAYGDTRGLTPVMDSLASKGMRFGHAYAGANFTLGSLATMLTGKFGSSTGVLNWGRGLSSQHRTLPEILGLYGYQTGGFSVDAATGFRPDYGLDKGFQRMKIIDPPRDTPDGRFQEGPIGPGGATAKPMAEWIASQDTDKPLFAMLHTRSAHFPFVNSQEGMNTDPSGVRKALWNEGSGQREQTQNRAMPGKAGGQHRAGLVHVGELKIHRQVRNSKPLGLRVWKETYAEAVRRTDVDIEVALEAVRKRGRKTIIILLADHGETLDDNGELLHGSGFFQTVVRVPMIISVPGLPGGTNTDVLVSQVDLLPTVAELVGVVAPEGIDGVSMVSALRGQATAVRQTVLVEGSPSWTGEGQLPGAVISLPYAMLQQAFKCTPALETGPGSHQPPQPSGRSEMGKAPMYTCLFNLQKDPGQQENLSTVQTDMADKLLERWAGFRQARAGQSVTRTLRLDPAMVEMLQRTGYDFRSEGE